MSKSRTRFAALPFRRSHGRWEVLLVTTRRSGRWVVPKGRRISGCSGARTAKIEAFEEAGVSGAISRKSIGSFEMKSRFASEKSKANLIEVYPLAVRRQHDDWLEEGQRERRWMTISQALRTVHPQGLCELLAIFQQQLRQKPPAIASKA